MNLDKFNLPVQSNGDAADQLQRVGMIGVGDILGDDFIDIPFDNALKILLQPEPGVYARFVGAVTNDVTGDQLIPTMALWVLMDSFTAIRNMNWVFAQNTRKQGEPDVKTIPDFMLLRAAPLLVRSSYLLYPLCYAVDLLLVIASIIFVCINRGFDDVDDNNLVITLVACKAKMPTLLSYIAGKIYLKLRAYSPEYALRRYHRTESGGNPEIGEQWCQLLRRYL